LKTLTLFNALSSQDLHWLAKFVDSPVHNKHQAVQRLFQYFRKHAPKGDAALFEPVVLSDYLFGPDSRDIGTLRHNLNYFQTVMEDFLAWQEWSASQTARDESLLRALQRRHMSAQGAKCVQRLQQANEDQPLRNAAYCRQTYKILLEEHQMAAQEGRFVPGELQRLSDWHDMAYLSEKLKNACILASRQRIQQEPFNMGLLDAVLAHLHQHPALLEQPSIAVYYYGYQTITAPDNESNFQALRSYLPQVKSCFSTSELRDIHLLAINFCIYQINRRREHYLREVFELYISGLESGVFVEKGRLPRFTYTNVVSTALRLREFDWAFQFIHDYRDWLPEPQRHGTFSFNLARYYSDKGDYDRAMPLLQQMDFDDPLLNLQGKMMLLKMYYETNASYALDSLLASITAYLRRKKQLGAQQRLAHQNALRFMRRLFALKSKDQAGKIALKQEISATDVVAMKEWLLEMLSV
jgi:hypothetical protein